MNQSIQVVCVAGARPNFMKIAPLMKAFSQSGSVQTELIHTGQHYDKNMSQLFFEQLGIPTPAVNFDINGGTPTQQIARIMEMFEQYCLEKKPAACLVVGDVNSTVACAIVAVN